MISLRFATFEVLPRQGNHARVVTRFPDGYEAGATRDVTTIENKRTASELGYTDSAEGVAAALLQHELLHSLFSDWHYDRPSRVLRHHAGAEPCPYHERIWEEACILGLELRLNTGETCEALSHFTRVKLDVWCAHAREWIAKARAG